MAYYILEKGFALRGWKMLPFGLRYPNPRLTDFFDQENYKVVYAMDGQHDVVEENLTEKQKAQLKRLVDLKIALPCDGPSHLLPYQEYRCYPAMYKNTAHWSITGQCNYKCRHCFMSAPDYTGDHQSMEQIRHILDELEICGIRSFSLTGGEPLIHPNFLEILDEIAKRHIQLETIYSNGALVNEKLMDELEKRGIRTTFHMSFDGVGWHDWLRGIDGAEEAVIRAFKLAKKRGYSTSASMCLHRHNISTLRETIRLLADFGLYHLKMNVATPTGRWKNETEHFISYEEAYQEILDYLPQYIEDGIPMSVQFGILIDFNKEGKYVVIPAAKYSGTDDAVRSLSCGAVRNSIYISPKGMVLPCMTMGGTAIESKFDNMLEKPLSDILSDSYYRDMSLLEMGACIDHNEKCRDCQYRLTCGAGCRACACGETGTDYLGADEDVCRFFKGGWYEKAQEAVEKYKDVFSENTKQGE